MAPGEEYPYPYPYPPNVFVPSFVTVKLSGRDKYIVWKTQMICLLESHNMLGFVNGEFISPDAEGKKKVGDIEAWRRSDALVKGWILGSLSEQTLTYVVNLVNANDRFISKDVWDKLHAIYGPTSTVQAASEEIKTRDIESSKKVNLVSKEEILTDEENKKKQDEEEKREREVHQDLYYWVLSQNVDAILRILRTSKVSVTDKFTINGNTALHVAVGTTKNRDFLEKMLDLAKEDDLLDVRNSEGSTLLHVASIVGNTEAAKILLRKNPRLLFAKDNEDQTPVDRAFSNMHTETYYFFLTSETYRDLERASLLSEKDSDELLINAISSKHIELVKVLLSKSDDRGHVPSDAVLVALAQNFPPKLNKWEMIVYNKLIEPFLEEFDFENCWEPPESYFLKICYVGVKYGR